jgi:hypothetical protein
MRVVGTQQDKCLPAAQPGCIYCGDGGALQLRRG